MSVNIVIILDSGCADYIYCRTVKLVLLFLICILISMLLNGCFKEAEITASTISGATRSLDSAQKKGSTILNLKCVDVQVI